jgi:hypothetical protein
LKRIRKLALYTVFGATLIAAAFFFYDRFETQREMEAAAEAQQKLNEPYRQRLEEEKQLLSSLRAPVPPSKWLQDGLAPMRSALTKAEAVVVVIPPMNVADKAGLDPSARILFARELAAALGGPKAGMVDPAQVFSVLGEPRSLDEAAVRQSLAGMRFGSVITGTVSVEHGKMSLRLQRASLQGGPQGSFEAKDLPLPENDAPERALAALVPDALRSLGLEAPPRERPTVGVLPALQLHRSPLEAIEHSGDVVAGLWLQQLFGVLASPYSTYAPRPQERAFERTLSALAALNEASIDHAVLRARALGYLSRRQAALRVLESAPPGPEAEAVRAYLNADIPSLSAAIGKLKRPVARLISELELFALRYHSRSDSQSKRRANAETLVRSVPEAWRGPVALFALSFDPWDYPSPLEVKRLLERDFPLPDYRVADLAQAKAALGGSPFDARAEAELTASALLHARRWRERHATDICCSTTAEGLAHAALPQYLALLEHAADALIVGQLQFLREIQGRQDEAIARARLLDGAAFGGGHPDVLVEKYLAFNDLRKANRLPPGAREAATPELFEDARKVISWVPFQSFAYAAAVQQWQTFASDAARARGYRGHAGFSRPLQDEPLAGDVPLRPIFALSLARSLMGMPDRQIGVLRTACEISVSDFDPCGAYVEQLQQKQPGSDVDQAITSMIGQRFLGFGARTYLVAQRLKDSNRTAEAKTLLRDELKSQPGMQIYRLLAEILRDDGEFDEAVKVYLAYPELKQHGQNTVELSNYLQPAAEQLMRRGATQARSITEAAAALHDGSQNNLYARADAALLRFDAPAALKVLQASYQRYPHSVTAGRIASLLFLIGQTEGGWSALAASWANAQTFDSYRAASIGLRASGAGAAEVLEWAKRSKPKGQSHTSVVGFRVLAQDRTAASIDAYFDFELDARTLFGTAGRVGNLREKLPPGIDYGFELSQAQIAGYRDLVAGRHEDAARAFDRLAQMGQKEMQKGLNRLIQYAWSQAYCAYALAKAGRAQDAAKLLEAFDPNSAQVRDLIVSRLQPTDFDRLMITAVLAAASGDHAAGLRALRLAQARMPESAEWMVRMMPSEYTFVEIAEWLARDSGQRAYLEVALKYARAYQLHEPWAAWAYAFEARHTSDPERRLRATGIALKLDPSSRRLQGVPPQVRQSAKQWLERNKPFERTPATRDLKA